MRVCSSPHTEDGWGDPCHELLLNVLIYGWQTYSSDLLHVGAGLHVSGVPSFSVCAFARNACGCIVVLALANGKLHMQSGDSLAYD